MAETASLELHFINVGQGDAVLIINRDLDALARLVRKANLARGLDHLPYAIKAKLDLTGTVKKAVLIDGGDDEYGGDVVDYLETYGVVKKGTPFAKNLTVVVSHYHDDHIGGVRSVFKELVPVATTGAKKKGKAAAKTMLVDRYRPALFYATTAHTEDPPTVRLEALRDDVEHATLQSKPTVVRYIDPGGLLGGKPCVIDAGKGVDDVPITLTAFAAARTVYNPVTKASTPVAMVTSTPDQNDRSVVLVLEYGSFRCFLGGDIAGSGGPAGGNKGSLAVDASAKMFFSNHADVESVLCPVLEKNLPATTKPAKGKPKFTEPGYCTVVKASHHGSSSSNDVYTLATLRPRVAVITVGVKARFHNHPTQQVMDRLAAPKWKPRKGAAFDNTLDGVYITEIAQKYKKKRFGVDVGAAKLVGDVIVRPVDETVKAIQDATKFGAAKLGIQVYGTGLYSTMDSADTELRPSSPKNKTGVYPIGPFEHECDLH